MSAAVRLRLALCVSCAFLSSALFGATFTVMTTADSGAGSLRQAILDANANPGMDAIHFSITGSGIHTIQPASPLPGITDPVTIDGYTQPGSSVNTDPVATNALLLIELDGSVAGGNGLLLGGGGGSVVQGLVVNRWGTGIATFNNTGNGIGNVVRGNFVGTDPAGTLARGNTGVGISSAAPNDLFGGPTPADRNLVSGNFGTGIGAGSPGVVIQGNLVGTDATGSVAIPNVLGISATASTNTIIGGSTAGAGNVISGNGEAIRIGDAFSNTIVHGNKIGTTADGTGALGNGDGVVIVGGGSFITIGGTGAGEANEIAFNAGRGVNNGDGLNDAVRGNSIHDNGGLGIDLNNDGQPNFNDAGDGDVGANELQNFPIIQSVTTGATTHIVGKLNSVPSTTFDLDFYANPACSNFPREFLEGETYLGSSQVTTDGSGNASIDVTLPVATDAGARISATATDPTGNTSEFSQRIIFSIAPTSGPAAGGTPIGIASTDFADPTTMTVGGVGTPVSFVDDHTLNSTTPPLSPGTVSPPFADWIEQLAAESITGGCGGGNYCPGNSTTRGQMAVFIVKTFNLQ